MKVKIAVYIRVSIEDQAIVKTRGRLIFRINTEHQVYNLRLIGLAEA